MVVRCGEEQRVRVNTAEELVVVVRAQAVAYSLLGRQTTKLMGLQSKRWKADAGRISDSKGAIETPLLILAIHEMV